MHKTRGRKSLLFLKKKKQKNFYPLGGGSFDNRVACEKSFLLLFFKKEDASFLPLAFFKSSGAKEAACLPSC
jgi:hypothetical protein